MADQPAAPLEADVLIGDFRIERRLGAGGMGVVYRARQVSLDRPVALKVLGGAIQTDAAIARFRREAQAIARLKHPGIAGIHYIGQDEQICYIAMEYVDGVSFRDVIHRIQTAAAGSAPLDELVWRTESVARPTGAVRFDVSTSDGSSLSDSVADNDALTDAARLIVSDKAYVRRCVELVRDAAAALAYAHEQGVIHRDVKPENLLLDRSGKVMVIDFGLARFYEDQTITYTGQLVGTPLYMSPEQIIGQRQLDGRTDVYSLGMVLHELLTLEPPITAPNRESLFRQIVTRPLPPIHWANPAVSENLSAVVHRALSKDPDERYATMAELAADLERVLAGKAVTAPPYRYRLDESEINARRPGAVLYLSFLCFITALMLVVSGLLMLLATDKDQPITGVVIFCTLIPTLLLLGWGILSGRTWGRWGGLAFAALILVLSIALVVLAIIAGISYYFGVRIRNLSELSLGFAVCLILAVACGLAATASLAVLAQLRVRRWFQFAAESRRAFRQARRRTG